MDDIFAYLEEITRPESFGPGYMDLLQKLGPLIEIFQAATSIELMDQWFFANADITTFECQEAFSRGFRLGAQLMLSLFTEPRKP